MMKIRSPLRADVIISLKAGDEVLLSGMIFTARDVAHKRFVSLLENDRSLPLDLDGQIIYYTGPSPAKPGDLIGSAGPTTSYRMDEFSPILLRQCGLKGMIGKGNRGDEVVEAIRESKAVYFAALGGAGALIAQHIVSSEVVCYEDLGLEAVRKLVVKDLPLVVAIDFQGNNLYLQGPLRYQEPD
jgi:fumarate hydratase subunit beta